MVGKDYGRQYMGSNRSIACAINEITSNRSKFSKPASVHEMSEEQKFTCAFSAAIDDAGKKTKFQVGEPKSEGIKFASREEHES